MTMFVLKAAPCQGMQPYDKKKQEYTGMYSCHKI